MLFFYFFFKIWLEDSTVKHVYSVLINARALFYTWRTYMRLLVLCLTLA